MCNDAAGLVGCRKYHWLLSQQLSTLPGSAIPPATPCPTCTSLRRHTARRALCSRGTAKRATSCRNGTLLSIAMMRNETSLRSSRSMPAQKVSDWCCQPIQHSSAPAAAVSFRGTVSSSIQVSRIFITKLCVNLRGRTGLMTWSSPRKRLTRTAPLAAYTPASTSRTWRFVHR